MKLLVSAIILLSAQLASANCTQLEAQMIATAKSVTVESNNLCRVQLEWSSRWMYNPSYQCPLDIDETSSFGVLTSCEVKAGDQVSGIVYRNMSAGPENIYLY